VALIVGLVRGGESIGFEGIGKSLVQFAVLEFVLLLF
jgi:hypothetical protein